MDKSHPQIDRLSYGHGPGDVVDHPIPRLDGIAEPEVEQRHPRPGCLIGHDPLPGHASIGVFPERRQRRRFVGPRPRHRHEWIDTPGGEEDKPRPTVTPCRDRRRKRVDRPGTFRGVDRAELLPRHVDHERGIGEPSDGLLVHQVASHGGDAMPLERVLRLHIGKPGDGGDPARPATGGVEPAANHPRKRRPHLPACPEDDDVPLEPLKSLDDAERGAGEMLLESRDVGEGFEHGKRVGN